MALVHLGPAAWREPWTMPQEVRDRSGSLALIAAALQGYGGSKVKVSKCLKRHFISIRGEPLKRLLACCPECMMYRAPDSDPPWFAGLVPPR